MKKVIALLLAAVLVVCMFVPAFAEEAAEEITDYCRFIASGNDPYANFYFSEDGNNEEIDPDVVRYAKIMYKTGTKEDDTGVDLIGQFYIAPAAEPHIPIHWNHTQKWETIIVDMTTTSETTTLDSAWDSSSYTSTSQIRFDPMESNRDAEENLETGDPEVIKDSYIDVAWIAFFEKEEDAKAYTGKENTPYCIIDSETLAKGFTAAHNIDALKFPEDTPKDPSEVVVGVPAGVVMFNNADQDEFFSGPNMISNYYYNEEDNCYDICIDAGPDPFITMNFGLYQDYEYIEEIDAEEYKVLQLCVKREASAPTGGSIYYSTSDAPGAFAEEKAFIFSYENTDEWQVININLGKSKFWEGYASSIRLDPFGESSEDTVLKIKYVCFFKDVDEAKAFVEAGSNFPEPTPTPEPTATPEPTPTKAPTEVPQITDAPEATAVPENKDNTDEKKDEKSGTNPAVIIVIAAVVVAAAAAAVVIIKKKK